MFATLVLGMALSATPDAFDEYREVRRVVAAGGVAVVVVGDGPAPPGKYCRVPYLPDTLPGVYRCYLGGDREPKMVPVLLPQPVIPRMFSPPIVPYFPVQTILGGA